MDQYLDLPQHPERHPCRALQEIYGRRSATPADLLTPTSRLRRWRGRMGGALLRHGPGRLKEEISLALCVPVQRRLGASARALERRAPDDRALGRRYGIGA